MSKKNYMVGRRRVTIGWKAKGRWVGGEVSPVGWEAASQIGGNGGLGEAAMRERVREGENRASEGKKSGRSETKKGAESVFSIKLLVTTCMSSLQATFSDKNWYSSLIMILMFMILFLATTYFHHYLSHSATKWLSSLIVFLATPLAMKAFVAKNLNFQR